MGLLRGLWNAITALRNIVFNLLFLAILIGVIVAISSQEAVTVPDGGALMLNPTGFIVNEKQPIDPFAEILTDDEEEAETLLRDIIEAIEAAQDDDRIKTLVLRPDGMAGASMSALQEIGAAIDEFKQSGKPVYAFAPGFSQSQYFLASYADEVMTDSHSFSLFDGVFLTGFGIFPTYFAEALDKLKVTMHTFRVGTYKSAVEPYILNGMSPEVQEESRVWLGDLWSTYAEGVTGNRGMTREAFDDYTNRYDELLAAAEGNGAQLAIDRGLIDEALSFEAFNKKIIEITGKDKNGDYARIDFRSYLQTIRPPIPVPTPGANQIAVITAKGTILDGDQPPGTIGGRSTAELIEQARENTAVKALVVRVDSPGGSANASERIRAQLALAQRAGKPVVISMGGMAASGGYWISASANKIFAMPSTITGSIGVFSIFPTLENSLAEIGINTDGIGTTTLSGSLDPTQAINPRLERLLQTSVETTYQRFLSIVADGRNMSVDAVNEIAQGRVWSGRQAVDRGLVDALGGLNDAIASAALLADVSDYEILHVQRQLSPREQLIEQLLGSASAMVRAVLGEVYVSIPGVERVSGEMRTLLKMSQSGGVYLHCATCRVIN